MKNLINVLCLVGALFASSITAQAQNQKYVGANASVALRIYNGYTGTVSYAVNNSGTSVVVVAEGCTNTITTGTNVSLLAAALRAVTNSSGYAYLIVDSTQSLPADTCIGGLRTATSASLTAGQWGTINWDTALCKFYQVSWPVGIWFERNTSLTLTDPDRPDNAAFNVTKIYGQPQGTGSVTVAVYISTNQVYGSTYNTPVPYGAGLTNSTETITLSEGNGGDPLILVPAQKSCIIRATRATSASGGNIGVITTRVGY